ncbi:collagen alpha-1(XII) chain-like [Camarhynchus parvulus]|uniref:collagen alpha-1(XII) chain-like n=1 Tax=Geospiza parvula TaxID=87175 RepID=UPI001237D860|nr:collagen alpha-1(XII) chain-like [Camarhynchus parvulus]
MSGFPPESGIPPPMVSGPPFRGPLTGAGAAAGGPRCGALIRYSGGPPGVTWGYGDVGGPPKNGYAGKWVPGENGPPGPPGPPSPRPWPPGWRRNSSGCSAPGPGRAWPGSSRRTPVFCTSGPSGAGSRPRAPGTDLERGFSVELHWEQAAVTDGDFAAAAFNILLPIGLQFQPQLVLVEASLEDLGGALGVSPAGFSLLTHLLSALARGRLLLLLQGGPDLGASPGGVGAVLRTLLGDPGDPLGPIAPTPSGLASIARTLSVQQRYWGCLQSFGEGNPDTRGAPRNPGGTQNTRGHPGIPQGHPKI